MEESDNAWVFDSLVCFLNGPVWNAPLQSFIEEKSLIFEANTADNVEYQKIFEEYKNLVYSHIFKRSSSGLTSIEVDLMLGSYMEDIGITPSQFEEACHKGHLEFVPKNFDHSLFEQIWAANDYDMFKRMMTQRNVELQLQALELIEQRYGVTPQSFIPHKGQPHITGETTAEISSKGLDKPTDLEEEIMEEVIKQFPHEDATTTLQEASKVDEEVMYLQEEKQILQDTLKSIEENSKLHGDVPPTNSKEEQKIPPKVQVDSPEGEQKIETKKTAAPTQDEIAFDKKPISTEIDRLELKKRQEYLRAQRDKLVALKKEARKKHLDVDNASKDKLKSRPKSAKVAEAVMAGNSANLEHQQLQIRKALAERLRSEVISSKAEGN